MPETRFVSRKAVRGSAIAAGAASVILAVAGYLALNREYEVDPLVTANFYGSPREEVVYREPTGEGGTYRLFIVNGDDVVGKTRGGVIVRDRGKQLATGLQGRARAEAEDVDNDGNLDIGIRDGRQYDVLLGDGQGNFPVAPRTIANRR